MAGLEHTELFKHFRLFQRRRRQLRQAHEEVATIRVDAEMQQPERALPGAVAMTRDRTAGEVVGATVET